MLGLCVALGLGLLSGLTHRNSTRPSFLISSYLVLSLLFDAARTRTAWLRDETATLAATMTAALIVKLAVLVLETINKRHLLVAAYSKLSYETTSGLISRGLFLWLSSLLRQGSKTILSLSDLFTIHEKLDPKKLTLQLSHQWSKSKFMDNHTQIRKSDMLIGGSRRRHGLAIATLWAWKAELFKIALPRILVVAFNIAQPFIIQAVVDNTSADDGPEVRDKGYALIGAVALAYIGTTV